MLPTRSPSSRCFVPTLAPSPRLPAGGCSLAVPISSSLAAHLRLARRRPVVSVVVTSQRGGMDLLRWQRVYTGAEPGAPHAAALAADGSLLRARNNGGQLLVCRTTSPGLGANFSSWSNLGACASGTGLALAARSGEVLLASVSASGLAIEVRTSADDGANWSAPATIVGEASAISNVALAFNPPGDACLFYILGASTALKRLRRTGGTWAGSGTNWTRGGSVASLTGLAACHDNADFALLVTGTEAATTGRRCWAVGMGDLGSPANTWTGLVTVAEADAASTVSFAAPSVANLGGALRGTLARIDSGPVAASGTMQTRPMAFAGTTGPWSEPMPHEAPGSFGAALLSTAGNTAWACTPSGVWSAARGGWLDVSAAVTRCDYRLGPRSARCRIELGDADGSLAADPLLFPGAAVTVRAGYASGPGGVAEFGAACEFTADRITTRRTAGRRVLTIEAVGPWEVLRRWHAPQTWQVAAGSVSRSGQFLRVLGRAGLFSADAGIPHDPGGEWIAGTPAFALSAGESAASAAERLLSGVSAETAPGFGLTVRSVSAGDPSDGGYGGAGEVPALGLEKHDATAGAWVRMQGAGRTAEAFDASRVAAEGSGIALLADRQRATDSAVSEGADAAIRRAAMLAPRATLRVPFDPARELWDVVALTSGADGFAGDLFRVVGIELDYRRGPSGSRYDAVITLGGR